MSANLIDSIDQRRGAKMTNAAIVQRPKKWLVGGLVKFVTAVARLVCLNLLGQCLSHFANHFFGPCIGKKSINGVKKDGSRIVNQY